MQTQECVPQRKGDRREEKAPAFSLQRTKRAVLVLWFAAVVCQIHLRGIVPVFFCISIIH